MALDVIRLDLVDLVQADVLYVDAYIGTPEFRDPDDSAQSYRTFVGCRWTSSTRNLGPPQKWKSRDQWKGATLSVSDVLRHQRSGRLIRTRSFAIDEFQFSPSSTLAISKAIWHPWGESGNSLWILTTDGKLR